MYGTLQLYNFRHIAGKTLEHMPAAQRPIEREAGGLVMTKYKKGAN
jgi:hypothetical protein